MKVTIQKACLKGTVPAIPSKSAAHRLLIAAALSDRSTDIVLSESSADIDATMDCLRALGSDIHIEGDIVHVDPLTGNVGEAVIDCGESGSTLRFLLPVVAALHVNSRIVMHGRLSQRPLSPLWEELIAHGAVLTRNPDETISVAGKLRDPHFSIAANVSSQYTSGLLFSIPLMGKEGSIELIGRIESGGYIDMTIDALRKFGLTVEKELGKPDEGGFIRVSGDGFHSPGKVTVEGDWSNGAFFIAAGALTKGAVEISGLSTETSQGDRTTEKLVREIIRGGAVIDAADTPDLVPVLAVVASVSPGTTEFVHAERLRIKESDRIASTVELIRNLGGKAFETADGLRVEGSPDGFLRGGTVGSHNDHRIAMSAAIAAVRCKGAVVIEGAEAVRKSYPGFWRDFESLGGMIAKEG